MNTQSDNFEDLSLPAADGRTYIPYADARQARADARRIGDPQLAIGARQEIVLRIGISGTAGVEAIPDLFGHFGRLESVLRHEILDMIEMFLQGGIDLGGAANAMAAFLNDQDEEIRERITAILLALGPQAWEALPSILGCTRHGERGVRLAALRLLRSLGKAGGGHSVVKRLQSMKEVTPAKDDEMHRELDAVLQLLVSTSTRRFIRPSSSAQPKRDSDTAATAFVLKIIKTYQDLCPDPARQKTALESLRKVPAGFQVKGLLLATRASEPSIRATAIALLSHMPEEARPYEDYLQKAYEGEKHAAVRDQFADLLCILDGGA